MSQRGADGRQVWTRTVLHPGFGQHRSRKEIARSCDLGAMKPCWGLPWGQECRAELGRNSGSCRLQTQCRGILGQAKAKKSFLMSGFIWRPGWLWTYMVGFGNPGRMHFRALCAPTHLATFLLAEWPCIRNVSMESYQLTYYGSRKTKHVGSSSHVSHPTLHFKYMLKRDTHFYRSLIQHLVYFRSKDISCVLLDMPKGTSLLLFLYSNFVVSHGLLMGIRMKDS